MPELIMKNCDLENEKVLNVGSNCLLLLKNEFYAQSNDLFNEPEKTAYEYTLAIYEGDGVWKEYRRDSAGFDDDEDCAIFYSCWRGEVFVSIDQYEMRQSVQEFAELPNR